MKVLNIALQAVYTEGYSYQDNLLPEYQHKLGHEVIILTSTTSWNKSGHKISLPECDKILENGLRLIRIKASNKLFNIIGYNTKVNKIIFELQPDLIFIHGLCNFAPKQAILYKNKINKHVILVADNHQDKYNTKVSGFPFYQLMKFWRRKWKNWENYFNYIYGTTSWRCDFANKYYGISKTKIDSLLLGIDVDNLSSNPDAIRKEIRTQKGIEDDDFVFIHGGKLDKRKKTIETIKAFLKITSNKAKLFLFGSIDNNIQDEFYTLIKNDDRITYLGYVESKLVHKYFYSSDFSVFPGSHSVLWEEALGCGLPGIYRKYGENDHTNMFDNCLYIHSNASVEELKILMERVIVNEELYNRLKTGAHRYPEILSYYNVAKKSLRK